MKFYGFIKDIENFLLDRMDIVIFLNKMTDMEEELLDLEEKEKDPAVRNVILKAMESLDNIRILIDSPRYKKDNIREEIKQLLILLKERDKLLQSKTQFMISKPAFEVHPAMKAKLPAGEAAYVRELSNFLKEIKKFSSGEIDKDTVLDKLDTVEEYLLDMVEFARINNSKFRNVILEAMEILDNLRVVIDDYPSIDEELLYDEVKRWIKTEDTIKKEYIPVPATISHRSNIDCGFIHSGILKKAAPSDISSTEADDEEELIRNITELISEDDILTSNYLVIKKASSSFLLDEIDEEEFIKTIEEMQEIIDEAREEYEEDLSYIDGWAFESSVGDRILRSGIGEWEEALDILYDSYITRDESKIKAGIEKAYEANKKLIINQKLNEYITDQVKGRNW